MEKKENRLIESLITVGGLLLIAGAAVYVTGWEFSPYFYLAGSIMFAVGQFSDRYTGDDPIIKRLRFQQVLGACFILITGFLMFSENFHLRLLENPAMGGKLNGFLITVTRRNNWIVTLSIGALFELYSSFRMDYISKH
ncbi:MAG: hypothetical protein IKX55_04130 [Bacteroidaceae bacterium]|nr:hypothetical protein [Bacteroidaceae bacterium]